MPPISTRLDRRRSNSLRIPNRGSNGAFFTESRIKFEPTYVQNRVFLLTSICLRCVSSLSAASFPSFRTLCSLTLEFLFKPKERFEELAKCGDDHLICVIEDNNSGKIVATGSVFIEKKFIRNCGKVGHIEDVVVDSGVRGKQLGKKVVGFLSEHARAMGCYKVILDCSIENRPFYERCGFKQKEIQMVKYFV
ncbi:Glucosamine 6-phosphate N-acetyltransferase [Sesamum angolense]|uniref:Glucosamine 6-phosphate N-acetyltransferase n=1 Tax=Sesamum angolense TaxID=2727404 RepID=A0AAE1WN72_9LAMI|nr:Glucosamine 6-phosphate N-acetyltransferase [Sesamum angolense]